MGLLSTSVLNHIVIYSRFDYYLRIGYPVSRAAFYTAEDNKISEQTVFNIKRNMEESL